MFYVNCMSVLEVYLSFSSTVYWKRRARTRGHGHGHGQTDAHERRTVMEKTAVMEKTCSYGKDGQSWKRWALMEKTGTYGKDKNKSNKIINKAFKSEIFYVKIRSIFKNYLLIS